ncbi:serine/threonine protein kinase, partial [Thiomicrospira microaerophila]|uniref:serine/threonine protein kinase n=1 Tax=Thiomicrospira microaerophila TaxID=406020 RepID=UPI0005CA0362
MSKLEFNHRTLPQGYQLGDYVIEDLLGQGGFGIAYLAKDIHLHNNVVIKEYFPNEIVSRDGQTVAAFGTSGQDDFERGMQRFVEEGRALARFNHPAVVRILKYFQQNNTAYLVMEFIDGEPLDKYLKRKETLTPEVVEHLASELLDGLTVVHQHGLIHRDIKPANIMLRPG